MPSALSAFLTTAGGKTSRVCIGLEKGPGCGADRLTAYGLRFGGGFAQKRTGRNPPNLVAEQTGRSRPNAVVPFVQSIARKQT
jgi:hypothetical protein